MLQCMALLQCYTSFKSRFCAHATANRSPTFSNNTDCKRVSMNLLNVCSLQISSVASIYCYIILSCRPTQEQPFTHTHIPTVNANNTVVICILSSFHSPSSLWVHPTEIKTLSTEYVNYAPPPPLRLLLCSITQPNNLCCLLSLLYPPTSLSQRV